MSKDLLHEIPLHLDDIQYLFEDPGPDSEMFVSGMDYLYSEIKTHSRHEKFKVIIELPHKDVTEGQADRVRQKMKQYCRFKIEQNQTRT